MTDAIKADTSNSKRRMLRVNFTGKEMLEGKIFDTTSEKIAKEFGLFDPKRKYAPLTIIIGEKELLPLVEAELANMNEGEEKTVALAPKDSFGERVADLVRVVPLKIFQDQKINPVPGLMINTGKLYGKVQSVSGGRVRVDFNHPFSGRDILYTVKVEKEITAKKEVLDELYDKYYSLLPGVTKEMKGETLTVLLPGRFFSNLVSINESVKGIAKSFGANIEFKEVMDTAKPASGATPVKPTITATSSKATNTSNSTNTKPQAFTENKKASSVGVDKTSIKGLEDLQDKGEDFLEQVEEEMETVKEVAKTVGKEKGLSKVLTEIVNEKKKPAQEFNMTRDSATTIQRPKPKMK